MEKQVSKEKKLLDMFIEEELLDDRREYDVEDFMSTYELSKEEAERLYALVQRTDNFWMMVPLLKKHATGHCDWEGFATGDGLEEKIRPIVKNIADDEVRQIVGDLLLHYAYESIDQADIVPSDELLYELAYIAEEWFTTAEWMKSGIKW